METSFEIEIQDIIKADILASDSLPLKKNIKLTNCIIFTFLSVILYLAFYPIADPIKNIPMLVIFIVFIFYLLKINVYNTKLEKQIKKDNTIKSFRVAVKLQNEFIQLDYAGALYEVPWENILLAEEDDERFFINFGKSDSYYIIKKTSQELEGMLKLKLKKIIKERKSINGNEL